MPSLLDFLTGLPRVDGPSLFVFDPWTHLFIALILGVGAVILVFANSYFDDRRKFRAFVAGFLPFTAAMIGLVALNHWLLMFLCWEATSLLSYYLISFYGEKPEARKGALQATLVTGGGGLCLLAAIMVLGFGHGLWTVTETLEASWWTLPEAPLLGWLFVVAALTKSAQFPFHFWLSGAMTAPTPASAFLHSATMVKAGIFLLARLHEGFEHLPEPATALLVAGGVTFLWGSFRSIFQNDLKSVLASTTIANLGVMTALLGLWARTGDSDIEMVVKGWILAHALYKASLFLYSGLVEEISGTRKLSDLAEMRLEGTRIRILGYALAGASLGMPFTLAYVPKAALTLDWPLKVGLSVGLLFLGVAGLLVAVFPLRRPRGSQPAQVEGGRLSYGMLIPPSILVAGSYLLPWFDTLGLPQPPWFEEMAFPGPRLDLNLASSFLVFILGLSIVFSWRPSWLAFWDMLPPWRGATLFQRLIKSVLDAASALTRKLHPGSLSLYLGWLWVVVTVGLGTLVWFSKFSEVPLEWEHVGGSWWLPVLSLVTLVGTLLVLRSRRPLESVITLGLVGYALAGVFAYLGAPDLALTQLAVENMSVIVLALAIRGMSAYPAEPKGWSQGARVLVSAFCGLVVGAAVTLAASAPAESQLRSFFSEASWNEAYGRNVVNVILVDFRAMDTLAEVTVVGLAAFIAYTLLRMTKGES